MKKNIVFSGLVALFVSLSSTVLFWSFNEDGRTVKIQHINSTPSKSAVYTLNESGQPIPLDFNKPAEKVLRGVVHIKSTHILRANSRSSSRNTPAPFDDLFGDSFGQFFSPRYRFDNPKAKSNQYPTQVGTGSGVIISEDGYIVTNNHVIADADDIEVTLHDNRNYKAKVVGVDPSTDLALIQIKEKELPTVAFANSDDVRVGQWVMAVGNPMGLNSTVTAGIISAMGRNINILKDKYAVEDFIQTDAAINPGNSGGALVNLDGSLVGINTAIASPTGTFTGYGFAVPTNIVNKVIEDLLQYGTVQRGVLGVMIRTVDGSWAKEKELKVTQGVYVDSLLQNSAARKAGIMKGDVIIAVDDVEIKTSPELQGVIARHRPGEKVALKVISSNKEKIVTVVLNNQEGDTGLIVKDKREVVKILGAELEAIDKELARKLNINGGVKVNKVLSGKLRRYTQMRDGFIITEVNDKSIESVDEFVDLLEHTKGGIMLAGVYEDIPGKYYYAFGMD